jgi:hypothetical protein
MYWSYLIHLGFNMWDDRAESASVPKNPYRLKSDVLRCDRPLWDAITARMAEVGMNQLVIDVGEALRYDSHPELAVEGSWSPEELNSEVKRLRGMGIEAIPKLNFSAAHDTWLGEYAFMVSSKPYYRVCAELIAEVADVFDKPALFHIGMDEETQAHQAQYAQAVIRQWELWYHDLNFYAKEAERAGARPWMWADRIWHHHEEYLANVPKSILQSNWYYGDRFDFSDEERSNDDGHRSPAIWVGAYEALDKAGFDQVPAGSNFSNDVNFAGTVAHCDKVIDPARLLGYQTAPWYPTVEAARARLLNAVDQVGEQIAARATV